MKHLLLLLALVWAWSAPAQNGYPLETVIQKGHELAVLSLAISPDSAYLATGSKDKSVKIWDRKTGLEIKSFFGFKGSVNSVCFSNDGKYLLGASGEMIRVWDVYSGQEIYHHASSEYLSRTTFSPDQKYLVFGGYSDSISIYDWTTKKLIKQISVNPDKNRGYGVSIAFTPDGKWLGIGETDRTFNIYRTSDWSHAYTLHNEQGWCGGCGTLLAFSPDSRYAYTLSSSVTMKKYDLSNGTMLKQYDDDIDDLEGMAVSPDGKYVARSAEESIRVWNQETGQVVLNLDAGSQANFHEVAFAPEKGILLVTSDDNTAYAYDFLNNKKGITYTGLLNERDKGGLNYDPNFYWESAIAKYLRLKNSLLITPDGNSLIKGKFGTRIKEWDIASGEAVMDFNGHTKAAVCYDLTHDGRYLVSGGGDGKVILWDVATGDSLLVLKAHSQPVFDVCFSHDEKMIASASYDATVRVYDLENHKWIHYYDYDSTSAYNLLFHPNDLYLFMSKLDHSVQMVELDTGVPVRNFIGHTDVVSSMRLSPDEKSLLTASWDGTVRIWDIGTGLMVRKFSGHDGPVHIAIFSADGKTIYSAGADRTILQWNPDTGDVVRRFEGHVAEITSLLLSPDGKMLISHSLDGVTKFWDINTGKEFFEHIHLGENDWMVKTSDGYFNGTQNARHYIHFVRGLQTYSIDQFFDEFYRPDLLPHLFQSRGVGSMGNLQGTLEQSPLPEVKVAVLPNTDKTKIDVYIKVTNTGGGVASLRLMHNGKSIPLDAASLKLPAQKGASATYQQTINLISGENTFTAVATNNSNLESSPGTASYFSDIVARDNTCYILAVGINQYKNPKMDLNYARPDAESFLDVLTSNAKNLFKDMVHVELYDADASRVNILKALDDMAAKIHPEDVFIFYYAGHGSMVDNEFYFIPSESVRLYDPEALKSEAIDAAVLQEKFKNIKALKQLIVMDACQSGGSVELLAQRGAAEEKAIAQLSRSAGIHVMASAGSEQVATEFTQLGHGLFTYVLLKALQGAADGAPKDGKVTIYELKSYIDDQMPELTRKLKGRPQYPYTFSRGQDFPIVLEVN